MGTRLWFRVALDERRKVLIPVPEGENQHETVEWLLQEVNNHFQSVDIVGLRIDGADLLLTQTLQVCKDLRSHDRYIDLDAQIRTPVVAVPIPPITATTTTTTPVVAAPIPPITATTTTTPVVAASPPVVAAAQVATTTPVRATTPGPPIRVTPKKPTTKKRGRPPKQPHATTKITTPTTSGMCGMCFDSSTPMDRKCEGCGVMVHSTCMENFIWSSRCPVCQLKALSKRRSKPICMLCGQYNENMLMIPCQKQGTTMGNFVHYACARIARDGPFCKFNGVSVVCKQPEPYEMNKNKCSLCKDCHGHGVTATCKLCDKQAHASCAFLNGWQVHVGVGSDPPFLACPDHRDRTKIPKPNPEVIDLCDSD